jgi:hypothetical protein
MGVHKRRGARVKLWCGVMHMSRPGDGALTSVKELQLAAVHSNMPLTAKRIA